MTIQSLDTQLLLLVNHGTTNTLFDVIMPALSARGYLLILPFLLHLIVRSINRKNVPRLKFLSAALWTISISCCAVFLAGWAEDALKISIARVRPCRAVEGIRLILPCPKSYTMPSGHAISSFAFAIPLFYLTHDYLTMPWRFFPVILASLIAFSRLYLGVHYPTDVLAGALLGSMIGLILSMLYQEIGNKAFTKRKD